MSEAEAARGMADWMLQKPTDRWNQATGGSYLEERVKAKVRELTSQIAAEVVAEHPHLAGYIRAEISRLVARMLEQSHNADLEQMLAAAVAKAFREEIAKRDDEGN